MSPPKRAAGEEAFSFWGIHIPVSGALRVLELLFRLGTPGLILFGLACLGGAGAVKYGEPLVSASIAKDQALTQSIVTSQNRMNEMLTEFLAFARVQQERHDALAEDVRTIRNEIRELRGNK